MVASGTWSAPTARAAIPFAAAVVELVPLATTLAGRRLCPRVLFSVCLCVCVSNQAAFVFRSAGQPHTIVVSSLFCAGKLFSARLEVKHGLQCEKRAKVCDFCFFVFFWVAFLEMVCMRLDFGPGRLWTVSRRILELRDTRVNCGWSKKLKRR